MAQVEKPSSEFEDSYEDQQLVRGAVFTEELGKVPRPPAVIVEVTASIADAIARMNGGHVGCALVVRDGKLVGIFTERDVLRKVAGAKLDLTATPVEQVMTPNPDTLPATASIAFALREMSVEGYRHIPLVNADGSPEGVVSVRDIVTWLVEFLPATVLNLPPSPAISTTLDGG
jgi:CBS domain-containing protein